MIERDHPRLAIVKQCDLLSISRSGYYHEPKGENLENLNLIAEIDRQFLEMPFYGVVQMTWHLRAKAWTQRLAEAGVRISMDGKGRFLDSIFIERLWRSLKYECLYLYAFSGGRDAGAGIGGWIDFYNHQRPHAAHGGRTPGLVYEGGRLGGMKRNHGAIAWKTRTVA